MYMYIYTQNNNLFQCVIQYVHVHVCVCKFIISFQYNFNTKLVIGSIMATTSHVGDYWMSSECLINLKLNHIFTYTCKVHV